MIFSFSQGNSTDVYSSVFFFVSVLYVVLYTLYLKSSNKVENQFDKLEKGLELWRKRDDDKTRFEFIRLRTPSEVFLY